MQSITIDYCNTLNLKNVMMAKSSSNFAFISNTTISNLLDNVPGVFTKFSQIVSDYDGFIAGGFARRVLLSSFEIFNIGNDLGIQVPDIDVYFKDEKSAQQAAVSFVRELDTCYSSIVTNDKIQMDVNMQESSVKNALDVYVSCKSKNFPMTGKISERKMKFQFITKFCGDPQTIFESYDFENVQVAITKDGTQFNKRFYELESEYDRSKNNYIRGRNSRGILSIYSDKSPCLLGRIKKYIYKYKLAPNDVSMRLVESRIDEHIQNQIKMLSTWLSCNNHINYEITKKLTVEESAVYLTVNSLKSLIYYFSDDCLIQIVPYFMMKNELDKKIHMDKLSYFLSPISEIERRKIIERNKTHIIIDNSMNLNFSRLEESGIGYPSNVI